MEAKVIKGHRPSDPQCLKSQYVVNMSITYMLKKNIRENMLITF